MVCVSYMEFLVYCLLLDAGMQLEDTQIFVHLGHLVLFDNILIISSIFCYLCHLLTATNSML